MRSSKARALLGTCCTTSHCLNGPVVHDRHARRARARPHRAAVPGQPSRAGPRRPPADARGGGPCAAAWYTSFPNVALVIYFLRTRRGIRSLPVAINERYGSLATLSFGLVRSPGGRPCGPRAANAGACLHFGRWSFQASEACPSR